MSDRVVFRLGRLDVFDRFRVCFHERERSVTFEPYGPE